MAGKKELVERMGDMLMHLAEKYNLEDEDPWLYKEVMSLLDELADDGLRPDDNPWDNYD